ncbi:hypothetical protein GLOTRDRAFT_128818 [Gloeophyllum trabeum ATCC 11539]|uniref:DUF6533 domain-containing protein n=1 Tax=Gloeophyllum trabeum (strain ATCC 11539 / FP-39264 / Madison 617) TaxID=670483 RepID=S7RME0_GLOTA|nr:uncharacterized protein GLOTRDRAFT_128818 [Gloeophyllum trabeum ATCC 11539]EPQ55595.1 hypothetical protein GLOTRDRAFT_128818 [Gloeophyllum trabeum ATCC 11539]
MDSLVADVTFAVSAARYQVVRYVQVVAMTLQIAEWCFIIGDEVEFIWPSPWSIMKCLYYISRYGPFIDTPLNVIYYLKFGISPRTCLVNYRVSSLSTFVGIVTAENILITRTSAIYGNKRKIVVFLVSLSVTSTIAGAVVMYFFLASLHFGLQSPLLPGCFMTSGSSIVFVNFVILVIWELLIVSMTVYRGIHDLRVSRTPLIRTLYRDGILFFFALLLLSVGNIIVFIIVPPEYIDLLDTIICCRVVLNIRAAAMESIEGTPRPTVSSITFQRFKEKFRRSHNPSSSFGTESILLTTFNRSVDTGAAR